MQASTALTATPRPNTSTSRAMPRRTVALLLAATAASNSHALQVQVQQMSPCAANLILSPGAGGSELAVVMSPLMQPFLCAQQQCTVPVSLAHNVSVYAVNLDTAHIRSVALDLPFPSPTSAGSAAADCASPLPPATATAAAGAVVAPVMAGGPIVGMLYEGWHGPAAHAQAQVAAAGGTPLSVEDVLRSNGTLTLNDVYGKYNISDEDAFYYQTRPVIPGESGADGSFYCIYRKRANESSGWIPDCPGITATLTRHAAQLLAAGITFVTMDGTNLGNPSPEADTIQVRPMEVLFEEWSALRSGGTPTPYIAAWQRATTGCTLWQNVLDLYNNASYADLVFKDPVSGKLVFFVPDSPDAGLVAQIESNGGRNNVIVQEMWALFDPALYPQGRWAFESPCTAGGQYTTSVMGGGRGATGCGQYLTTNSSLGSVIGVSPSYQLSYGSVPFSAAGKFDGLTFKRQFGTIFDLAAAAWRAQAAAAAATAADSTAAAAADSTAATAPAAPATATGVPQYIYLSSYNEAISQPQPNPFNSAYSHSMGLGSDPAGKSLFVDTYGASISRDIEPSVAMGSVLYDIMASCLRAVQLMSTLEAALLQGGGSAVRVAGELAPPTGTDRAAALRLLQAAFGSRADTLTSCSVAGEICCAYNETSDGYAVAYSLQLNGAGGTAGDNLATTDATEVAHLTCPGCGWSQVCNAYGGGTDWCTSGSVLSSHLALQGPFVLHSGGCRGAGGQLPGRTPVYRCASNSGTVLHFMDSDPSCTRGGIPAHAESQMGCADAALTSNMPRSLRVCAVVAGAGPFYHSLDGPCDTGHTDLGLLGYVH